MTQFPLTYYQCVPFNSTSAAGKSSCSIMKITHLWHSSSWGWFYLIWGRVYFSFPSFCLKLSDISSARGETCCYVCSKVNMLAGFVSQLVTKLHPVVWLCSRWMRMCCSKLNQDRGNIRVINNHACSFCKRDSNTAHQHLKPYQRIVFLGKSGWLAGYGGVAFCDIQLLGLEPSGVSIVNHEPGCIARDLSLHLISKWRVAACQHGSRDFPSVPLTISASEFSRKPVPEHTNPWELPVWLGLSPSPPPHVSVTSCLCPPNLNQT